jgi:hydrogenase maturation protease
MNTRLVEEIAAAVLYEGYLLYPYRASAIKNKQRWNFGVLYPRAYAERQSGADASEMRTECLAQATTDAMLTVRVRFLHLIAQIVGGQSWQSAMEREINLPPVRLSELTSRPAFQTIVFPPIEGQQPIEAAVAIETERIEDGVFKIRIDISNTSAFNGQSREEALMQSLVSTHTILGIDGGEFVSLLEPTKELRDLALTCANSGTWPVLVGESGQRDAMLSSPIILYDYPQIAPESPGALFDGTEIDEILTLRIMTLTDQEKAEMARVDERARQILERTESMPPEQFMKMHGVLRGLPNTHREPQ